MSKIYKQLKDYINWAFSITITVAVGFFAKDQLSIIFSKDLLMGILYVSLLIITMVRFFLYIHAVRSELDILNAAFITDNISFLSGKILPTVLLLSGAFGVLLAIAHNIIVYAGILLALCVADIYGQSVVIRNVCFLIVNNAKRNELEDDKFQALIAFYIGKPLIANACLLLFGACGAFLLNSIHIAQNNILFEYASYILLIIAMVIVELMLYDWRQPLYRAFNTE